MKILVLNWQDWTHPEAGGAEIHLRETFRRLVARGHSVTLFCSHFPGSKASEMLDGIQIIRRGSRSIFNFIVPLYYALLLQKQEFDVVVDDINKIPFLTPLYIRRPLVGLCHHFFGKTIFQEVGRVLGSYVLFTEYLAKRVYQKMPFLVVSQSTVDELIEAGYDRRQFTFAMNAIEFDDRYEQAEGKFTKPTIAYVGRLKKYKSVDQLIRAFAVIRPSIPDAELLIVGKGDHEPALRALADELRVGESIKFIGFITEEEKLHLLGRSWVCVNPSIKEGWGIVNIEASACGTPSVAADSPGLRDSVKDGVTGLLYPYGNIAALADTLKRLLTDEPLRAMLGKNGIAFARSFDWEATTDAVEGVLEETSLSWRQKKRKSSRN